MGLWEEASELGDEEGVLEASGPEIHCSPLPSCAQHGPEGRAGERRVPEGQSLSMAQAACSFRWETQVGF